jgi:hypothetical protein
MKNRIYPFVKLLFIAILILHQVESQAQLPLNEKSTYDKGYVFFGATGGASIRDSENENALVLTILEQQKRGYNFLVTGGYFIKPTLALGGALRYDESRVTKLTEDTDGIISNIQEAGTIITSSVYAKYFIPLTPNGKFNLYSITGLGWIADRNTTESFTQNILTRTYTNKNTLQLGISPGIQVFVIDGFATEVGVNVAGFSGSRKIEMVNGVENTAVNTFDLDLRINILSLNISFYYYFPVHQ